MECPVCSKTFTSTEIENHVELCLNGNDQTPSTSFSKRTFPFGNIDRVDVKKPKMHPTFDRSDNIKHHQAKVQKANDEYSKPKGARIFGSDSRNDRDIEAKNAATMDEYVPLAERLRPVDLSDYIGQKHVIGSTTVLGQLMEKKEVTSMILWGPPGCGKTSLATIIAKMRKDKNSTDTKFIKLSATSSGIAEIRQAVDTAIAESKNDRRTIVFMDEIHRFNKLQQDIFLPHVEAGTFILIGATTENPSFSLNSALLSRCRVFALQKHSPVDIKQILEKGIASLGGQVISGDKRIKNEHKFVIEKAALDWLSEICDGDARMALTNLELTIKSRGQIEGQNVPKISLKDVKSNFEKAYSLPARKSDRNPDLVAAMHKCIKESEANGALYWLARLMATGEDPVYIGKRLIRIASEDVALDDPDALDTAVHAMHGCQMIGMPECDLLLAQCVCYLCKASKTRVIDTALRRVEGFISDHKGPQPPVPLFIRDGPSSKKLEITVGKHLVRMNDKSRNYLPVGLESRDFFKDDVDADNRH